MSPEPSTLTVETAVEEIGRVERLTEALERRTSAITNMIWALTTAGIFLSYAYAGAVADDFSALLQFLWVPWVLVGSVATVTLWRSVGLAAPALDTPEARKQGMLVGGLYVGLIFVAFMVWGALDVALVEPAVVLVALGAAMGIAGATGLTASDRGDRVLTGLLGLGLMATAVVASVAVGTETPRNYEVLNVVAPAAAALALFGLGMVQLARG